MALREIDPKEIKENVFEAIGTQWMLITAGSPQKFNTMTASWGALGVLWNNPVSFAFVRHSRYTFQFMEKEESYSLCFFEEEYREALKKLGTLSGRDTDKLSGTGLHEAFENGVPYFEEASLVLICRKVYSNDLAPGHFLDASIHNNYPDHDYHRAYIGNIVKVLEKVK